jgi:hypothetical protein
MNNFVVDGTKVYTKNNDGTIEPWYFEKELTDTMEILVRKSPRPKWIDTFRRYPIGCVYLN